MPASSGVQDKFEDLFECIPCGYISADKDGRIRHVNKMLAAWVGRERESLIGRRFSDLLTTGGKLFHETHFAPMLRMQGSFSEVALDLACADGRRLPVLVNAVEQRDHAGSPSIIRFAVFRAAERRRYERNLLDAKISAEGAAKAEREALELREQFIAVLGHDLRNPLASISSGLHMLAKEPLSEKGQNILALMAGSVARASSLIDNVMDFARAQLGGGINLAVNRDKPLAPVIEQVVAELRSIAPERTIDAKIDIDRAVDFDVDRIGQLVSNLLGNAINHGAVDHPVTIRAFIHDDVFELWVANGGPPIPDRAIAHLFRPFVRGTVRAGQQGLGLGLYIASEIAKAHGGQITVSSMPKETRFTLTIPLRRSES